MESPISRSYINEFTFNQMIKKARVAQMREIIEKIGEYNSADCQEDILDKVLENTSKTRVRTKFKALKNARNSL